MAKVDSEESSLLDVTNQKRRPPPTKAGEREVERPPPPKAQGHRFGPNLACCWCGVSLVAHHRSPQPCRFTPS